MRSLLWSYLGSRRFPREMSTFEVRRFFALSSNDRHVLRRRFRAVGLLTEAAQCMPQSEVITVLEPLLDDDGYGVRGPLAEVIATRGEKR
jgi:hypothetical protein